MTASIHHPAEKSSNADRDLAAQYEPKSLRTMTPSQAVLAKCGFTPIGTASDYLFIAGRWQDHRLYQRLLHDGPPG